MTVVYVFENIISYKFPEFIRNYLYLCRIESLSVISEMCTQLAQLQNAQYIDRDEIL
jgi:hypothetical protein